MGRAANGERTSEEIRKINMHARQGSATGRSFEHLVSLNFVLHINRNAVIPSQRKVSNQ